MAELFGECIPFLSHTKIIKEYIVKVLAINGSPRKTKNTGQLLGRITDGAASTGAEVELVHLRDYSYTGCISCFACKLPGGPSYGRCAVRDGLTSVLDKAHAADVVVLGAPVYFGSESGFMRDFMERFWFQYYLYSTMKPPLSPKKKATALVYTMNIPEDTMVQYGPAAVVERAKGFMTALFGQCDVLLSCDTLQFDDYSKYETDLFDDAAKRKRHDEVFPQELEKAFALGKHLAG